MVALPTVPSALVQVSLPCSTAAPVKDPGVVTVRGAGSVVGTVQGPLAAWVPADRVQSAGAPLTVTVVNAPVLDASFSAKLIACPATPAGARLVNCGPVAAGAVEPPASTTPELF